MLSAFQTHKNQLVAESLGCTESSSLSCTILLPTRVITGEHIWLELKSILRTDAQFWSMGRMLIWIGTDFSVHVLLVKEHLVPTWNPHGFKHTLVHICWYRIVMEGTFRGHLV